MKLQPKTSRKRNRKNYRHQEMKLPNGYGTIRVLSGNRRNPYWVGVNPKLSEKGSYLYDCLGTYPDRITAMEALMEYHKEPYNLQNRNITFEEVYQAFFADKYEHSKRSYSAASRNSTMAAFNNVAALHPKRFLDLTTVDLQRTVNQCTLKHSSLELIVSLFHQMYDFAARAGITRINASQGVKIEIPEDDEHGIRFLESDIDILRKHTDDDDVKMIFIYLYTGWRATELTELPKTAISFSDLTMTGGKKTAAGKGRILPIHPFIQEFVHYFYSQSGSYFFTSGTTPLTYINIRKRFHSVCTRYQLSQRYTLHDCRHTFASWLSDIGTPEVIQDRLMGHTSKTLDNKVYIHKTVEQLREWIQKLP